jgi:hypothetical protein
MLTLPPMWRCITSYARKPTPPVDFEAQEHAMPSHNGCHIGVPLPALVRQTASIRGYRGSAAYILQLLEHPAHSGYPEEYDQNTKQDH